MEKKSGKKAPKSGKPKRGEPVPFHEAAVTAFRLRLGRHLKNGDVTLVDEYRLSKRPPRIDMIIVKKNREVELEASWGKIFRGHNVIEYKSPVAPPLTLAEFDKVHGYAGLYAYQNNVKITDMTATIVCSKRPKTLFETLKKEFNYKVLQKDSGIYYTSQKGAPTEKTLAVQVVVSEELGEDEPFLKWLKAGKDAAAVIKTLEQITGTKDEAEEYSISLDYLLDAVLKVNSEIINQIGEFNMKAFDQLVQSWEDKGLLLDRQQRWVQKGEQAGMQAGMQELLKYLEKGHSIEEAKTKFLCGETV